MLLLECGYGSLLRRSGSSWRTKERAKERASYKVTKLVIARYHSLSLIIANDYSLSLIVTGGGPRDALHTCTHTVTGSLV